MRTMGINTPLQVNKMKSCIYSYVAFLTLYEIQCNGKSTFRDILACDQVHRKSHEDSKSKPKTVGMVIKFGRLYRGNSKTEL